MIWTIRLPYQTPPLSANDRDHWRVKARKVAGVRATVYDLVAVRTFTTSPLPVHAEHVTVTLTYYPRDRRRRDADNLVPTLKAACDGLVDARVVRDDTPDLMTKHMPVIAEPDGDPRLELTVEAR